MEMTHMKIMWWIVVLQSIYGTATSVVSKLNKIPSASEWFPLHTKESSTRNVYNITHLVYQYYLVCGPGYICDKEHFEFVKYTQPTAELDLCPMCSCEKTCVQKRNCCPDVMFSFPDPVCAKTSILNNLFDVDRHNYFISECHDDSSIEQKQKCHKNYTRAELMQNPPVTSTKYGYTFQNQFCAECNGVFNFSTWGVHFLCAEYADFNYLSTYEEILDLAENRTCSIEYRTDVESTEDMCNIPTHDYPTVDQMWSTKGCNITGTWTRYDADIANACQSEYKLAYKGFTSIFCYLCNPPVLESDPVVVCNVSGFWYPYDSTLEEACHGMPATPNTPPFKNVFCFLCNRNNTSNFRYQDADAWTYAYTSNGRHYYDITLYTYNLDFYNSILETSKYTGNYRDKEMLQTEHIEWNTTKLLLYHYALHGTMSYCSTNFTKNSFFEDSECLCDRQCLFSHKPPYCCHDVVLDSSTSCFSDVLSDAIGLSTPPSTYGAITGCTYPDASDVIRSRCERHRHPIDVFSTLPVLAGDILYTNFDCFQCNRDPSSEMDELSYTVWNIRIECRDSYTEFKYYTKVMDVIAAAKRQKCNVRLYPKDEYNLAVQMSNIYCESSGRVDRCNATGRWDVYDQDIQLACERLQKLLPPYDTYKNVYCYMCNTARPSAIIRNRTTVDTCQVPSDNQYYGPNITIACETLPEVPGFGHFRNVFCKTCSFINSTIIPEPNWMPNVHYGDLSGGRIFDQDMHEKYLPNMRDLLSFNMGGEVQIMAGENDKSHYKDRKLTCFPGKRLVNENCQPLLEFTSDLQYALAISLEGSLASLSLETFVDTVETEIKSEIANISENVMILSFHVLINISCGTNYNESDIGIKILLHTSFLIASRVNRLQTEQRLMNMTNTYYNFGNSTFLTASASVDAFRIPSRLNTSNSTRECYKTYRTSSHGYNHTTISTLSIVSNLLVCTHVVLDASEYVIEGDTLILTMSHFSKRFNELEYILIENKARICLDDFMEAYNTNHNKLLDISVIQIALNITTFFCVIISLVCLLLTFITYCLFPVMRSIPGINNMNLVLMMFFSQLLFQFGFKSTSLPGLCILIGFFIHFFWLSMFACMSVCSFHMYSVFAGGMMAGRSTDGWKRRILMYMFYSHGGPVILIAIHMIIIACVSSDGGTGYGYTRCFINNALSFYVTFLTPVILISVSNIYFFIQTAVQIQGTPEVESTLEKRNQFIIYVKLFSLTGITWILLIVDTLFPITVFSFLVVIATACQGLFVFASFVLNRRVFNNYSVLVFGRKLSESQQRSTSLQTTKL